MVQIADRRRRQVAGRGVGRDPRQAASARRGHVRRRRLRRGDHGAGVLRRGPAPGHEGCRAAREPERAAPDQRADRRGDRLRTGERRRRACTRSTTSAAARSTSRCCGCRAACSRWSRPAAIRRSAATISMRRSRPGRSPRAGLAAETPQDKRAVLVAARATKEKLTSHDHAELACPLADGELAVRVARERFEAIVQPLVDRTIAAIGRVLRDAKAAKSRGPGRRAGRRLDAHADGAGRGRRATSARRR